MRELSGVSFIRALISFVKVYPHDPVTSQKPYLLIPSLWRLEFLFFLFFKFHLFIFREKGREGERKGEKSTY